MPEVRIDPLTGYRVIVATGAGTTGAAMTGAVVTGAAMTGAGTTGAGVELAGADGELAGADVAPGAAHASDGLAQPPFTPLLTRDAPEPEPSAHPDLFWAGPANGAHELIELGPPVSSIGELSIDDAVTAVDRWRDRMRAHADASCLHLYSDERPGVLAHAQLLALDFVPAAIARERERFRGYATRTMGGNLLGDLLQNEVRNRERIVAIDSEAVLLSAYAARAPYQLMLVPRTPRMRFEDDGPTGAALLRDGVRRLATLLGSIPPLSLWVRTAPRGSEHFCWRVDVMPRLPGEHEGGLELGAGLTFNPVSPEAAAAALRAAG
jgi:UDPglucose--hexose-1-phosphate uridylyltransferase